jgi:aspartate kinase
MNDIKVFKFGGASVKNAEAVHNVAGILRLYSGEKLVVVFSAMGKVTNALEELHNARFHKADVRPHLQTVRAFHEEVAAGLLVDGKMDAQTERLFDTLEDIVFSPCTVDFDMEYDRVVSFGELISTSLIHSYLVQEGLSAVWSDARHIVRTDARHRDARVDWVRSATAVSTLNQWLQSKDIVIIQGFIGSSDKGNSTTLGREGSDFTAAIMAYLLNAASVTIWKDVPGMLNADPKWFKNTVKLDRISFREAIELAYYGASVIHPKTIKPLQNKGIPLFIKSFLDPAASGTVIQEEGDADHLVPSYIFRSSQVLVSVSTRDFSFVVEDNLRDIFDVLSRLGMRVNMMENSAISFSMCLDYDAYKLEQLFDLLKGQFQIKYNEGLLLITVRHYDEPTIAMLSEGKEVMLEQRSRQTLRMVVRG